MTDPIAIRRLLAADAALYRAIRLEALERNPEAFGSTLEIEGSKPLAFFADRLEGSAVFGALRGADILGTAGIYWEPTGTAPQTATLWTVYVQPAARRTGLGQRLVEAAIAEASARVGTVLLKVNSENREAIALYVALGFSQTGIDLGALVRNGRVYDELVMAKTVR